MRRNILQRRGDLQQERKQQEQSHYSSLTTFDFLA